MYEVKSMKYILTITSRRKNAKRHIVSKFYTLSDAEKVASSLNKSYIIEIYNTKWELVKVIN